MDEILGMFIIIFAVIGIIHTITCLFKFLSKQIIKKKKTITFDFNDYEYHLIRVYFKNMSKKENNYFIDFAIDNELIIHEDEEHENYLIIDIREHPDIFNSKKTNHKIQ